MVCKKIDVKSGGQSSKKISFLLVTCQSILTITHLDRRAAWRFLAIQDFCRRFKTVGSCSWALFSEEAYSRPRPWWSKTERRGRFFPAPSHFWLLFQQSWAHILTISPGRHVVYNQRRPTLIFRKDPDPHLETSFVGPDPLLVFFLLPAPPTKIIHRQWRERERDRKSEGLSVCLGCNPRQLSLQGQPSVTLHINTHTETSQATVERPKG